MNRLPQFPLRYLISRGEIDDNSFSSKKDGLLETVNRAVAAGIELVQIREKKLSEDHQLELTSRAVKAAAGSATKILLNDRFDIALAAGAAGVHLTGKSLPASAVRPHVPVEFIIGVSAHSKEEINAAAEGGADFALFGPVYETPGKGLPVGIDRFRDICHAVSPFPVIGVGGIDEGNFETVLESGAAGFAAIRYLNEFVMIEI